MLKDKILNRQAGILLYGITPPKDNNTEEKIKEVAAKQIERVNGIGIDGLIVYDLQDEAERTSEERPFPFISTIDPGIYANQYLEELNIPKIVYRCTGKYTGDELSGLIAPEEGKDKYSVFVGVAAENQKVNLKLPEAYELAQKVNSDLLLGGVTIPERHMVLNDEHIRIIDKINKGCKFFVSQAVYNIEASKNFLSEYYYYCKNNHMETVPIIFTLTPCGSLKTLDFMKWLGISIPAWLKNDLVHSENILDKSIHLCWNIFCELWDFAKEKNIPVGFNIESVSVRKTEIEASIELAKRIKAVLS